MTNLALLSSNYQSALEWRRHLRDGGEKVPADLLRAAEQELREAKESLDRAFSPR